ncbi:hypothetical protein [Mangrovibacterium lignilyticum]|uniref:hypothetical protein n=1 Tax=Mangrovibacterium lignilyticum TaxID=2668052 RepID=UPI0013D26F06|nr:hypothetical protein [Mangrovibacterium lignilyticum]
MDNLKIEYIAIVLGLLGILGAALAIALNIVRKKSNKSSMERYDENSKMIELDYFRKNLERQQYELAMKMEETERRWKDLNHLIISSQDKINYDLNKSEKVYYNEFLRNSKVNERNSKIDNSLVFVLTPFNERFNNTYRAISSVCNRFGLRCLRGDEKFVDGDIFPEILKHIVSAKIIIANITGRNPNVFYELGIAHALNKPTIIISENLNDATFDIKSKNILLFKHEDELIEKLEDTIVKLSLDKL